MALRVSRSGAASRRTRTRCYLATKPACRCTSVGATSEGGGRQQDFHNSSFRGLLGLRGAIADGWDYDASVQFSRTTATQLTLNYFQIDRINRAMDVVNLATPTGNVPICRSALPSTDPRFDPGNVDPNCAPYNPFAIGGVTQEALNYLQVPGLQQGVIDQSIVLGMFTGDLGTIGGKLPWADDSIKVAFGIENRNDRLTNETDFLLASAGLSGTGGATIAIEGVNERQRLLHGSERSARARPHGCGAVVVRHRVSPLGLQLRHHDGHL